jgi:ABC-2 type transport system permease protein
VSFRRLYILARREALATLRDPFTVTILVAVPLMALALFSSILSTEVKGLDLAVLDMGDGPASRRIVADLAAQGTFVPRRFEHRDDIERALRAGDVGVAIVIPPDFERDRQNRAAGEAQGEIQVLYDGGEAVLAGNAEAYLRGLVGATALDLASADAGPSRGGNAAGRSGGRAAPASVQSGSPAAAGAGPSGIRVVTRALFNPRLDGKPYMIAGTFGFVLSFATTLIIAVSVVNERFAGTFEQLQVTPATNAEILLGKVLPLGAVFSVDVFLMMVAAWLWFGVWPAGSALFFLLLSTFYMVVSLSLGVLISATSATAAEAVSKTVLMSTPLIQLSGFAFPIDNMALPFRWFAELIPATHYIRVSRAIYLRGEGPIALLPEVLVIVAMGLGLGFLALRAIGKRQ